MGSVRCWPWGTMGLRGACRRAWLHLLQDRLRLPWQRWNWRVCWTPQSFLLWVLRDGGAEGRVWEDGGGAGSLRVLHRLNKVNLKKPPDQMCRPDCLALCSVVTAPFSVKNSCEQITFVLKQVLPGWCPKQIYQLVFNSTYFSYFGHLFKILH